MKPDTPKIMRQNGFYDLVVDAITCGYGDKISTVCNTSSFYTA